MNLTVTRARALITFTMAELMGKFGLFLMLLLVSQLAIPSMAFAGAKGGNGHKSVVKTFCEDNATYTTVLMRTLTGKSADEFIGCRMMIGSFSVRTWPGTQYVVLKQDSRLGIPQVLLDYGNSKSPRIEGSIRTSSSIVYMGLRRLKLKNGSVVSAALFALEEGMSNIKYDNSGFEVKNKRLDTLNGKYLNVADTSNEPGVGKILKRIMGRKFNSFVERSQLASPVVIEGRYLIANACMPHACNMQNTIVVINMRTKMVYAAMATEGNLLFFGDGANDPKTLCEPIKKWARDNGSEQGDDELAPANAPSVTKYLEHLEQMRKRKEAEDTMSVRPDDSIKSVIDGSGGMVKSVCDKYMPKLGTYWKFTINLTVSPSGEILSSNVASNAEALDINDEIADKMRRLKFCKITGSGNQNITFTSVYEKKR